ncbi:4699_t:CDS:2 [Paraglomus brasilianum]|uniref:4699_t:CDS:1 n=1 Tax=Paraglomus brasilianum TaxID=144538 RepID=A0A9N9F5U4_9GLOM|nr:4699_t:CDS:2 [Paraglomus brasilianum]
MAQVYVFPLANALVMEEVTGQASVLRTQQTLNAVINVPAYQTCHQVVSGEIGNLFAMVISRVGYVLDLPIFFVVFTRINRNNLLHLPVVVRAFATAD